MFNLFRLDKNESNLVDIHSHVVPYVDDGTDDYVEAKELITELYSQGVRTLVMTAHLRSGMFDTPMRKVSKYFNNLVEWLSSTDMSDMEVFLSREYYCDERLSLLLDGYTKGQEKIIYEGISYDPMDEIVPFGHNKCILLEFSSDRMQDSEFEVFIMKASQAGLTPIIAHAERCPAVQERPTIVCKMKDQGALIQVNCESLLSKSRSRISDTARFLVENKMADIAASDCHDLANRQPNMAKCYAFLKKKYGVNSADALLREKAISLIDGN